MHEKKESVGGGGKERKRESERRIGEKNERRGMEG